MSFTAHPWYTLNHRIGSVRRSVWLPSWMRALGLSSRVFAKSVGNGRVELANRTVFFCFVPAWVLRMVLKPATQDKSGADTKGTDT